MKTRSKKKIVISPAMRKLAKRLRKLELKQTDAEFLMRAKMDRLLDMKL